MEGQNLVNFQGQSKSQSDNQVENMIQSSTNGGQD